MRKTKTGVAIVIVVSLMFGFGGCFMVRPTDEETEARINEFEMKTIGLEYLKDRYGVSFELTGYLYGGWANTTIHGFRATTRGFEHEYPFSIRWKRENGVDLFEETYLYWPMEVLYSAALQEVVRQVFPTSSTYAVLHAPEAVSYRPPYPDTFNGMTTYEEFHSWGRDNIMVDTIIGIPTDEAGDFVHGASQLEITLKQIHPIGSLSITVMPRESYQSWTDFEPPPYDSWNKPSRWDNIVRDSVITSEWGV